MKRLISLGVIAALFAAAPILRAADPILRADDHVTAPPKKGEKSMRLTDADNNKTVKAAVGTPFDIALKGNATTGFQWQVDKIEGDAARQKGKVDYIPDKHAEGMTGYGGTFIFSFNAVKAGKTKIQLVYVRPWEKDKPPEKSFAVTIDSTPPSPSRSAR